MLLKEIPVVQNKEMEIEKFDHQYDVNKVNYLFFLCSQIPNDWSAAWWLGSTAVNGEIS